MQRLLLPPSLPLPPPAAAVAVAADEPVGDVDEFTRLALTSGVRAMAAYVESLRQEGATLGALFLDLLTPTAHRLGELWLSDRADFADVTIGLSRLQQVLRMFADEFAQESAVAENDRRVLLTALPGDQHTFGVLMVAEFFRRANWSVDCAPASSIDGILRCVAREPFDVIGLSVANETLLDGLPSAIRSIRHRARNPRMRVLVGGVAFVGHPERVSWAGADATAADAPRALALVEELKGSPPNRI